MNNPATRQEKFSGCLASSANNMLTRPRATCRKQVSRILNAVGFIARQLRLPEAGLSLLDLIHHGA